MRLGRDFGSGLVLLAGGAVLTWQAYDLGIGTLLRPRTGFLSFYLGLIVLGAAMVLILQSLKPAPDEPGLLPSLRGTGGTLRILLPILAWCLVVDTTGFIPATFVLMWWLFAGASGSLTSWRPMGWSALATATTWLVFERLLGAGLPPMRFF